MSTTLCWATKDYKIKELKAQIDPKNDSIAEMKKQIQAMDSDLEDYHKKNKQLQVNITQLTSKQKVLQDEIIEQRRRRAVYCSGNSARAGKTGKQTNINTYQTTNNEK